MIEILEETIAEEIPASAIDEVKRQITEQLGSLQVRVVQPGKQRVRLLVTPNLLSRYALTPEGRIQGQTPFDYSNWRQTNVSFPMITELNQKANERLRTKIVLTCQTCFFQYMNISAIVNKTPGEVITLVDTPEKQLALTEILIEKANIDLKKKFGFILLRDENPLRIMATGDVKATLWFHCLPP